MNASMAALLRDVASTLKAWWSTMPMCENIYDTCVFVLCCAVFHLCFTCASHSLSTLYSCMLVLSVILVLLCVVHWELPLFC